MPIFPDSGPNQASHSFSQNILGKTRMRNRAGGGSISKRPISSKVGVLNLLYPISLVRKTLIYRLLKISEDFAAQESSYEPKCSGTLMICPKTEGRFSDGLKIFFENQDLASKVTTLSIRILLDDCQVIYFLRDPLSPHLLYPCGG